jgi:hypothetical protein
MKSSLAAYVAMIAAMVWVTDRWDVLAVWTAVVAVAVGAGAGWCVLRGDREGARDWSRSVLVLGFGGCCAIALGQL